MTTTTTAAFRQTLHQLLEDAGTRDFVNTWSEEAIYQVADGFSRKEAIVLLAYDLRRMQEKEVPEFTPVLRALEAVAGPQQVVAVETVGATVSRPAVTSDFVFDDRYHACPGARAYARDTTPELVRAEDVLKELENAASNIDLLAYNTKSANQSVIDNLAMFKAACLRLARLANTAQEQLGRLGHKASPAIDEEGLTRLEDLLHGPKSEIDDLKDSVENTLRFRESLRRQQPPNQKQQYDRAKRARDLPRRTYWTRETARRLGVQALDV